MRIVAYFTIALLSVVIFSSVATANDFSEEYYQCVGKYYSVPATEITKLVNSGLTGEDLPVALFLARSAGAPVEKAANLRLEGKSWTQVMKSLNLNPRVFYIIVNGEISSQTYAPIFTKFQSTPRKKWDRIEMSDSDIINLVNLKFLYSFHDYSAYKIMSMRDGGENFVEINHDVKSIRAEMIRKEEAAMASQNE